jgi:Ca-activated chloride channel family protein
MRRVETSVLTAMKTPLPIIIASSLLMYLPVSGQAQSLDDVHLTPRGPVVGAPTANGPAQEKGSALASDSLHVNVDVVLVPVTVTDEHNRSVTKLDRADFTLFEQNKRQDIRYFSAEDEPLSVAILFDVSKSMTDKLETERAALVEFFKNANSEDEYFAITFSDRPRIIADSTRSIDVLESKLLSVQPGGPTAMLDAISLAEAKLRHAHYQRKAIVIFSDGGDNASQYTLREIKALVEEADVQVYAVGLFDTFFVGSLEEKLGKRWLSDITDRTGGRTLTVDNCSKLPQAAAALSREMRNQYILGYRPEDIRSRGWRKIRIVATEPVTQKSLHANYKKGYLASSSTKTPL